MRIEHFALNVNGARAMVQWYKQHLGMPIHVEKTEEPYTAFLGEAPGILEIYENRSQAMLDLKQQHPLMLHVAFTSDDVHADRERLLVAGAAIEDEDVDQDGYGLLMLRCPWGLAIQLCRRRQSVDGT